MVKRPVPFAGTKKEKERILSIPIDVKKEGIPGS